MSKRGIEPVSVVIIIVSAVIIIGAVSGNIGSDFGLSPASSEKLRLQNIETDECTKSLERISESSLAVVGDLENKCGVEKIKEYARQQGATGSCEESGEADLLEDSVIDVGDIIELLRNWGCIPSLQGYCSNGEADINEDDIVDVGDIISLLANWGEVETCEFEQNMDLFNAWFKEDQNLILNINYCSDPESVMGYEWYLDGELIGEEQAMTLEGRNYSVGEYELTGKCIYEASEEERMYQVEILGEDDFTIIALPDTQGYVHSEYSHIFYSQVNWISEMEDRLDIIYVTQEGDLGDNGGIEEWLITASEAMSVLDENEIPYGIAIGNHDYLGSESIRLRGARGYDKYFDLDRFGTMEKVELGGWMDRTAHNFYHLLEINGYEFLALHYEFCPRDEVLEWGNEVLNKFPDKRTIVTTHLFINGGDRRSTACGGLGTGDDFNHGFQQWDNFVTNHENIFWILNGHESYPSYRCDTPDNEGHNDPNCERGELNTEPEIHQIGANYQLLGDGGDGWLRIMTFKPSQNIIKVQTYSPFLNGLKDFKAPGQEDNPDYDEQFIIATDLSCKIDPWDADDDGLSCGNDNCPSMSNLEQEDMDNDFTGDVCDNCPIDVNFRQRDGDKDGVGDVCDDSDGDGIVDASDEDIDGDGVLNEDDNCLFVGNPEQEDVDLDGLGDLCDQNICGNGIKEFFEECDDGNSDLEDDCDTLGELPNSEGPCTFTFCRDGIKQELNGRGYVEECDDGNLEENDACIMDRESDFRYTCLQAYCGDRIVWTEDCEEDECEECDDGNPREWDECTSSCRSQIPTAIVEFEVNPLEGIAPFTTNFLEFAYDLNEDSEVELCEWDFDGDGTIDLATEECGFTSFDYTYEIPNPEGYYPYLQVTNTLGGIGNYTLPVPVVVL